MLGRIKGKVASVLRALSPVERGFKKAWPKIDAVPGLLTGGQEKWLFDAAFALTDGATIVEIGSYKGRSTVAMGLAIAGTRKHIWAIDTFNGNDSDFTGPGRRDYYEEWRNNIEKNGLLEAVTPVVGDSANAVKSWNRPIDFLFIDASHVYDDAMRDFDGFYPHVKPGGLMAMHDVGSHDGPTRVWSERKNMLIETGNCDTIAFGRKGRQ